MKQRNRIQKIIGVILIMVFMFAKYPPLLISCYLVLIYIFLNTFHEIKVKETTEDDETPFIVSDTVMVVIFQLISFGLVFLFTWLLLDWKLQLI